MARFREQLSASPMQEKWTLEACIKHRSRHSSPQFFLLTAETHFPFSHSFAHAVFIFVIFFARTLFFRGVFLFLKTVTIYGKKMSWPRVVFNLFSVHSTALEGNERKKRMRDSTQSTRAVGGWVEWGDDCVRAMETSFRRLKTVLGVRWTKDLRLEKKRLRTHPHVVFVYVCVTAFHVYLYILHFVTSRLLKYIYILCFIFAPSYSSCSTFLNIIYIFI